MNTHLITITPADGVQWWAFRLLGEDFGGCCRTYGDALNDVGICLRSKLTDLDRVKLGQVYEELVGYDPFREPGADITEAEVRGILYEYMHHLTVIAQQVAKLERRRRNTRSFPRQMEINRQIQCLKAEAGQYPRAAAKVP